MLLATGGRIQVYPCCQCCALLKEPWHLVDVLLCGAVLSLLILLVAAEQVEIKPDMVGTYLAEYSISYKPVKHGAR